MTGAARSSCATWSTTWRSANARGRGAAATLLKRPRIEAVNPEKLRNERRELKRKVRENFARIALGSRRRSWCLMPLIRLVRDYASEWVMTRLLVDMQRELVAKLLRTRSDGTSGKATRRRASRG